MNEHDRIQMLLALTASGDLSAQELRRVQLHLSRCEECRGKTEDFALIAETLRSIPTPTPRPEIVAEVRALMASGPRRRGRGGAEVRLVAPFVAASWLIAWISWPLVKVLAEWLLVVWRLPAGGIGIALVTYSIVGVVLAAVSAIAVGTQAIENGRTR